MEQADFDLLVGQPDELIKQIQAAKPPRDIATYQKQYDPKQHDIYDGAKRPDKIIEKDGGSSTVSVARLGIPFQKKIVTLGAAILTGNPVQLMATPADESQTTFLEAIKRICHDNKTSYKDGQLVEYMSSETETAELWYAEKLGPLDINYWAGTVNEKGAAKFRLRMKVLSNQDGDGLYPVFSSTGDMIAFARTYVVKVGDKNEERCDIYTATKTLKLAKTDGWVIIATEVNFFNKIPIIYYSQPRPDWWDVQDLIDRFEKVNSNHGDTNDYFGSPLIFVEGKVTGFAGKGEQGKVLQAEGGAKASYLTWNSSPESVKMEYTNLKSLIHYFTETPEISLEQMANIGAFSGAAMKFLFLGAHLKAAQKERIFGEGVQRRINFLKAAQATINISTAEASAMTITPKFEYYLPKNEEELINMLSTATGGKASMSQRTAVSANPYVSNVDAEMAEIEKEEGTVVMDEI
jgi:SPP1 family phage portal protein